MNEQYLLSALQRMRNSSAKRGFNQTVEFIVNFRGIDFKKPLNRVNVEVTLPYSAGKKSTAKLAVFVSDKNFGEQLKEKGATVILESDIQKISKKQLDQLILEHAGFLAQGPAMLTVGKHLGQLLAPKGKMPKLISTNPSAYDEFASKAATSIKVSNNKGKFMPLVQVSVGKESQADNEILKNIDTVYNAVVSSIEGKEQSIKSSYVKMTMGSPIKVLGAGGAEVSEAESMARATGAAEAKSAAAGAKTAEKSAGKTEAAKETKHPAHVAEQVPKAEHKTTKHEKSEK